jgi:hypothetical protein
MEIAEPVRRRIGGQALGLRRLSGFFEFLGWLDLIGGVTRSGPGAGAAGTRPAPAAGTGRTAAS